MIKIILLFTIIGMTLGFTAEAYADLFIDKNPKERIHFDSSVDGLVIEKKFGTFIAQSTDLDLFAVGWKQYKSQIDEIGKADTFRTPIDVGIDSTANVKRVPIEAGDIYKVKKHIAIVDGDKYKELTDPEETLQIPVGVDTSEVPSKSGIGTWDNGRYTFGNVLEPPTFLTSKTEIHLENLKAIDRYVPVYVDGYHFYTIDLEVDPTKFREGWLVPSTKTIPIPFGVNYYVTDEGQLIGLEQLNQKTFILPNGQISYYSDIDNVEFAAIDFPEYSYAQQMSLASWLRT